MGCAPVVAGHDRWSSKASAAMAQRARSLPHECGVVLAPAEASLHSLTVCVTDAGAGMACLAAPGVVLPYGAEHVPRVRRGER
jgi:hypothetical protein